MDTSTLNTMITYQRWAQEKFYRKAGKIPADMLLREVPLSHGNLLATILHPVDTLWYWRSACECGETPLDRLSIEEFPTVKAIAKRWETEQVKLEEYAGSLKEKDLNARVEYSWPRAKPRSEPFHALNEHLSAVGLHDFLGDGQAKAGSLASPRAGLVHPVEALKHPGKVFCRNTRPIVRDGEQNPTALLLGPKSHIRVSGRGLCVLKGVVNQVVQYLPQSVRVAGYARQYAR